MKVKEIECDIIEEMGRGKGKGGGRELRGKGRRKGREE